jgi:hypothetical protein
LRIPLLQDAFVEGTTLGWIARTGVRFDALEISAMRATGLGFS